METRPRIGFLIMKKSWHRNKMDRHRPTHSIMFRYVVALFFFSLIFSAPAALAQFGNSSTCIGGEPFTEPLTDLLVGGSGSTGGLAALTPEQCCFYRAENEDCNGEPIQPPLAATPEEWFWLTGTICLVQTTISQGMFEVYCHILGDWNNVLAAAITLYLIFYAIALIFGINNTRPRDGIMVAIKGVIIIWIVQDPYFVFDFMYTGFIYFINGMVLQLACSVRLNAPCTPADLAAIGADEGGVFGNLELLFNALINPVASVSYLVSIGLIVIVFFAFGVTIPFAWMIISGFIGIIRVFISMIVSYITAFMAVIFLLAFSPVFFTCFLFSYTRSFFFRWLANLISYTLQPILVTTFLFLIGESVRIDSLYAQIGDLSRSIGLLPACDINPLDVNSYHASEKYGLFDVDDRFIPMITYFPWNDDPPTCALVATDGSFPVCPFYVESTDLDVCSVGTECFTYGPNIDEDNAPTFDARYISGGTDRFATAALAQLDGNTNTGIDVGASNQRNTGYPHTNGLDRVECYLFIPDSLTRYIFGNGAFTLPGFRNPVRQVPVPAHYFGVNEPNPDTATLVSEISPPDAEQGDIDAFYLYNVSFIVFFETLVAVIISWHIISTAMNSFIREVPDFARQIVQFEDILAPAVVAGKSHTFREHGYSSPSGGGDLATGNYTQSGVKTRGGHSSFYSTAGGAASIGGALGRVAAATPFLGGAIANVQSAKNNQIALAQNFAKGGGLYGRHKRIKERHRRADLVKGAGIASSYLGSNAEKSAADNPIRDGARRINPTDGAEFKASNYQRARSNKGDGAFLQSNAASVELNAPLIPRPEGGDSLKRNAQKGVAAEFGINKNQRASRKGQKSTPSAGDFRTPKSQQTAQAAQAQSVQRPQTSIPQRSTTTDHNIDIANERASRSARGAYAPKTERQLAYANLSTALQSSSLKGVGRLLRTQNQATYANAVNRDAKKKSYVQGDTTPNLQSRDSGKQIRQSATSINKNASKKAKDSKLKLSGAQITGVFVQNLFRGHGIEQSIHGAIESSLNRAERNAKQSNDHDTLREIGDVREKLRSNDKAFTEYNHNQEFVRAIRSGTSRQASVVDHVTTEFAVVDKAVAEGVSNRAIEQRLTNFRLEEAFVKDARTKDERRYRAQAVQDIRNGDSKKSLEAIATSYVPPKAEQDNFDKASKRRNRKDKNDILKQRRKEQSAKHGKKDQNDSSTKATSNADYNVGRTAKASTAASQSDFTVTRPNSTAQKPAAPTSQNLRGGKGSLEQTQQDRLDALKSRTQQAAAEPIQRPVFTAPERTVEERRARAKYENREYAKAAEDFERNQKEIELQKNGSFQRKTDKENRGRTDVEKLDLNNLSTLAKQQQELLEKGYTREDIIKAIAETRIDNSIAYDKELEAKNAERVKGAGAGDTNYKEQKASGEPEKRSVTNEFDDFISLVNKKAAEERRKREQQNQDDAYYASFTQPDHKKKDDDDDEDKA